MKWHGLRPEKSAFPLYSPLDGPTLPLTMIHFTGLPPVGMFGLGAPELILILVILLVLFGGSKLPSLARGLGQSMKEFKKASREETEEEKEKPKDKPAEAKKTETAGTPGAN